MGGTGWSLPQPWGSGADVVCHESVKGLYLGNRLENPDPNMERDMLKVM